LNLLCPKERDLLKGAVPSPATRQKEKRGDISGIVREGRGTTWKSEDKSTMANEWRSLTPRNVPKALKKEHQRDPLSQLNERMWRADHRREGEQARRRG